MTCSSSYLKFSKKESNVSWIGDSFRNVKEFYKYIQDKKIGKIYSLNYAYQTSQRKPFIIIGKIIRLSPRLTDIRKAVCKKAEPATTLLVKELVAENGNILFGKVFKVKFVGKIASDVESSDIHIGDRIALVSPTISQNTDFVQHPDINPLSALLFDGTQSSVLFCAKLPVGVLMPKNKCLSRLRCSTPVSDGRSELEASESECVENKGKMSSSSGALMKSVLKRNILKEHAKQNSPKKKSNQNTQKLKNEPCSHPALSSDIQSSYDATGPKTMKAEKSSCSPQKSLKQKDVAVEDDDGNCKIEHVAEDNQLINQDLITSFVSFKKNDRNINHNFIKIRDVNERHINKKIDMFVIVLDVRQNEVEGKKKKCLVARVIDDTCNRFKPFTVYIYFEDKKPKVEPKWILRLRHVKIESYNGICDGRVFSAGSVVAFSPNCSDLEREKPITLRKAPYECNDYDMSYVSNLRKFLLGKHWNLISMMEGFYPTPPDIVKQTTLADITDETWFSLKCKIVHVRMFFDYNVIVLTVTDGTEFPHFSYCVPRECKLWSETIVSKERYFSDLKEIDIILKNVGPAFDSSVLKAQNSVLIHNIQVVRNRSKNLEAIIFVIDASRPECKIEIIPTLADLNISSVAEENCSVTNAGTNEVSGQQESNSSTFDKIYKEKIISVARGLCDTSIDLDKDAVVDEAAKYCLEKQGVKRKKLFYQDSSNFDELISETESTSDFYEFSKSNKVKKCSVVLNKVPDEPIIVDLNEANVSSNVKDVTLNEVVVVNNEVNNSKDNLCEKDNVTSTFDECRKAKNVSHSSTDFDCDDEIPLKRIILSDDKRVPPCKSNVASDTVVKESTTNKQAEFYEPIPEKEKDHSRLSAPHSRINVSCNKEKNYELHQHHEGEIFLKNSCSSFMKITEQNGVKIMTELKDLNLLPVVVIEKIDDSLLSSPVIKRVHRTGNSEMVTSFSLHVSEENPNDSDGSDKQNEVDQNEKVCVENNSNEKETVISESAFNNSKCVKSNNNICVKSKKCKINNSTKIKNYFSSDKVIKKFKITDQNIEKQKKCDNLSLISVNQISQNRISNGNNLTTNFTDTQKTCIKKRKLQRIKNKINFQITKKNCVVNKDEMKAEMPLNKRTYVSETEINNFSEKQLHWNDSLKSKTSCYVETHCRLTRKFVEPVFKECGIPRKDEMTKRIEEISKTLSESQQKSFLSVRDSYPSVPDNEEYSQSDMEFTCNEKNDSLKSEGSHQLSHISHCLCNENYFEPGIKEKNLTDCNQCEIDLCSVANNITEESPLQLPNIFSVSNQVPKRSKDEIKSSLKSKILSRNVSEVEQNNLELMKNYVSPSHSSCESVDTIQLQIKNKRKFTARKALNLSVPNNVSSGEVLSRSVCKVKKSNLEQLRNDVSSSHSSCESVANIQLPAKPKRRLTDRKAFNLDVTNNNVSSSKNNEKSKSQIEEWLQNIENVGSDDNVVESRLAGSSHDRGKESEGTKIVVHSTSNKETESQSQNVSEFIKANPQANSTLNMPMSAIIVNKQMSFKALMWELQPKITDNPLDIVSGLCENSCENFFLFSTLKYSLDSKPICPLCLREGKEVEVKLQFLFELLLMIQTGHSVTALVYGDHAVKFFGCTVEQYLHCPEERLEVIRKLQYFLGAGHNSSIRYTPPFPVHLIPISLTGSDKTSAIRFCVINTELPPVNYQSVNSLFINSE